MCKIAYSSGGCGDIVFQVPAMKELGVAIVHMPFAIWERMHRLLEHVGFICAVAEKYTNEDYNMDDFRKQPRRGVNHIMVSIANQFGTKQPDFEPWLSFDEKNRFDNPIIHVTSRWREGSIVNWRMIAGSLSTPVFVGLESEWDNFTNETGIGILWVSTRDILALASLIWTCTKAIYCNQSIVMALCQAMGKEYYGEFKVGKTNCRTFKPNEHVL